MENKNPFTDNEIIKALECCNSYKESLCFECPYHLCSPACLTRRNTDIIDLINRKNEKIEELEQKLRDEGEAILSINHQLLKTESETNKSFAQKVVELLNRYSNVHKNADEARYNSDEYPDGTTSEMTSVWEVQSLTKHGMADYETMAELQKNIEYIAQDRLLSELKKDFQLLIKEVVGAENATTTETVGENT